MKGNPILLAFNRGLMSPRALARVDLKKTALAAEVCVNWLPRTLGSMSLRPGTEYLGRTHGDGEAVVLPFVFSTDDSALIELTSNVARVWADDAVLTAEAVSTTLSNGTFATDLSGWTDADEAGGTSAWLAGSMSLTGNGTTKAIRYQALSVSVGDQGTPHTLAISTSRIAGNCVVRVGTSVGGVQLAGPITLRPGDHIVTFTPTTGTAYVQFENQEDHTALVDTVSLLGAGALTLATVWGGTDLANVRWEQSGDVIFTCDGTHRQQRIERWGVGSWSVVDYRTSNGPFMPVNTGPITITSAAYTTAPHEVSLTASADLFTSGHVGALFRLERSGQTAAEEISGENQWTGSIRVTGVGAARAFALTISGKADASIVTLQRSIGAEGDWTDISAYTVDVTGPVNDGLDNNIAYYRLGVDVGDHDTDTFDVSLEYAAGVSTDVVRVSAYSSPTVAYGVIESSLGGFGSTSTWWEGRWSTERGWPSAVALHEGRLWWAGGDRVDGSVSDSYDNFDDETEGDSGPISRNLAVGPVDTVNWMVGLDRLLLGTEGSEIQAKSSSLDEPLTPSAFSLRAVSTQGSARLPSAKIDTSLLFIHRNGSKVYELSPADGGYGYASGDMCVAAPDIGKPGIVRMAVSRQPDTRVWCVRADGTLALYIYDKAEDVRAWVEVTTDGQFESVAALPAQADDSVYFVVKRAIDGATRRYIEKLAPEAEIGEGETSRLADCHLHFAGPLSTVSGLDHLEAKDVVVWADGRDVGTFTVDGGAITMGAGDLTDITVGLGYTAQYKSARVSVGEGAPFAAAKQITHVALIMQDVHAQGIRYGQSFDYMDDMPLREGYADVDQDTIHVSYEEQSIEVPGRWEADSRLCLEAQAPRPCTVLACVLDVTGHAK